MQRISRKSSRVCGCFGARAGAQSWRAWLTAGPLPGSPIAEAADLIAAQIDN